MMMMMMMRKRVHPHAQVAVGTAATRRRLRPVVEVVAIVWMTVFGVLSPSSKPTRKKWCCGWPVVEAFSTTTTTTMKTARHLPPPSLAHIGTTRNGLVVRRPALLASSADNHDNSHGSSGYYNNNKNHIENNNNTITASSTECLVDGNIKALPPPPQRQTPSTAVVDNKILADQNNQNDDDDEEEEEEEKEKEEDILSSSTITSTASTASVAVMLNRESKRILIEELGFRRVDVNRLKPELAPAIIEKRIMANGSAMPESWLLDETDLTDDESNNDSDATMMMRKLQAESQFPLKLPLLGISLILLGKGLSDLLITVIKVQTKFPGASLTETFGGVPVVLIDLLCILAGTGLGYWTWTTMVDNNQKRKK